MIASAGSSHTRSSESVASVLSCSYWIKNSNHSRLVILCAYTSYIAVYIVTIPIRIVVMREEKLYTPLEMQ